MAGTVKTNEVKLVSPNGLVEKTLILGNDGVVTIDAQVKQGGYYIVESGSNANGNYTKFSDGTMICHMTHGYSLTAGTPEEKTGNFPSTFLSAPTCSISINGINATNGYTVSKIGFSYIGTSSYNIVTLVSYAQTYYFGIIAIGKWR